MRKLTLAMMALTMMIGTAAHADLQNFRSEQNERRQQSQARKALATYKRAVLPASNGGKMVITAGYVSHEGGLLMKQVRVNGMRLSTYGTMGLCYRLGYMVGEATKAVLNATEEKLAIPMLNGDMDHETFAAVDDAEVAAGAVHCHDAGQPSRLSTSGRQAAL